MSWPSRCRRSYFVGNGHSPVDGIPEEKGFATWGCVTGVVNEDLVAMALMACCNKV